MPIYEFECDSCGARTERILKAGDKVRPACPSCRKRMRRMISSSAFILKGAGWYVTDYPSQDRKKGVEAEKGPETAKPAATAEKPVTSPEKEKKAPVAKSSGEKAKKGRKG